MATGGDLSRSQTAASDVIYDYPCSPCSKDGKNAEAEYHCVQCKTDFCGKCIEFHNRFLSGHTLLDKSAIKPGSSKTDVQNSSDSVDCSTISIMCEEHPGETIKLYCGRHDVVCCTVCIALKHRSCDGVEYIPRIAEGQTKGQEQQRATKSLEDVRPQLQLLMSTKKKDFESLNRENDEYVKRIRFLKNCIVDRVEELERESIKEVKSRHRLTTDQIQTDIKTIDDMLTKVDKTLDNVKQTSADNETELFIHVKEGQTKYAQSKELLKTIGSKKNDPIVYDLDTEIMAFLYDTQSLASIRDESRRSSAPSSATFYDSHDVKLPSDKKVMYIADCCVYDDDQLFITDSNNYTLKRLDSSFNVIAWLEFPGGCPYGMCQTGHSELAVTLQEAKKVQFVSVSKTLSLSRSFNVSMNCRGICFLYGKLYVCCGGGIFESQGQVKVFDLSGTELHVIAGNQSGSIMVAFPISISVDHNQLRLYVASKNQGLLTVDILNDDVTLVCNASVNDVTVDDSGNVYACNSNNIVLRDRRCNYMYLRTLFSERDAIKVPLTVTFLKHSQGLLVSEYESNKVKLFKLK